MREARTRSIVCTLGLLPLWASLLPAYLVFDPMARAAILPGALAASALAVSAVFLTDLLRRHGLLSRPRARPCSTSSWTKMGGSPPSEGRHSSP